MGFCEGFIDMGDVAQAECDCVDVEVIIGEGQVFGVAADPVKALDPAFVDGTVAANFQHCGGEIADGDVGFWADTFAQAECYVACAAGHIEEFLIGLRAYHANEAIFPKAMKAARHQVIHDVIFSRDGIKYAVDKVCLFFGRYSFCAKLCFLRVLHIVISNVTMYVLIYETCKSNGDGGGAHGGIPCGGVCA